MFSQSPKEEAKIVERLVVTGDPARIWIALRIPLPGSPSKAVPYIPNSVIIPMAACAKMLGSPMGIQIYI